LLFGRLGLFVRWLSLLVGWPGFSAVAGDTPEARQLFAEA